MATNKKITTRFLLTKRISILPLYLLFIFLGLCGTNSCVRDNEPANSGISTGDALPDFSVLLNNGTVVSNLSLRGKVAVIEFFNTGCGDCRRNLPVIDRLWKAWQTEPDVEIFTIAREEDEQGITAYWEENDLSIPFSPQPDRNIYNLFATVGIPRIYIADKDGVVFAVYGPEDDPSFTELNDLINSLLPLFTPDT